MRDTGEDLKKIIEEARILSITWKHGFINYDHFFVAMLNKQCRADNFLIHCDRASWLEKIKQLYPATGQVAANGSLPLTIQTERVLRHAGVIADINGDTLLDTVHVLLAILSFTNDISTAFSKKGIAIEDMTAYYFKKPIKQFPPILKSIKQEAFTKTETIFLFGKSRRIAEFCQNAYNLYSYHQYDDCIACCVAGLSLAPGNIELRMMLAYSHFAKRAFDLSLPILKKLVEDSPLRVDFRSMLSYAHDELTNYTEAAEILDALLADNPDNSEYLNNRGFNLLRQQRYAEAVPFFEKAIAADPGSAFPSNNLGFSTYKLGNTKKAFELINRSLELDRGNSFAYKHKGIIFMEQGDKEQALQNFHLALKFGYTEKYGDEVNRLLKNLDQNTNEI